MDFKNLPAFVLLIILVGLLVGVGVLVLDKFGDATRVSTVISNESFTMPLQNAEVTLSNGNITSFTRIDNSTAFTIPSANYTVDLSAGTINNTDNTTACSSGDTCYAYYTYDEYDTAAATVSDASRAAVGSVSTTWLGLIVTIGVLAIIITLVIAGFGGGRRD